MIITLTFETWFNCLLKKFDTCNLNAPPRHTDIIINEFKCLNDLINP